MKGWKLSKKRPSWPRLNADGLSSPRPILKVCGQSPWRPCSRKNFDLWIILSKSWECQGRLSLGVRSKLGGRERGEIRIFASATKPTMSQQSQPSLLWRIFPPETALPDRRCFVATSQQRPLDFSTWLCITRMKFQLSTFSTACEAERGNLNTPRNLIKPNTSMVHTASNG